MEMKIFDENFKKIIGDPETDACWIGRYQCYFIIGETENHANGSIKTRTIRIPDYQQIRVDITKR